MYKHLKWENEDPRAIETGVSETRKTPRVHYNNLWRMKVVNVRVYIKYVTSVEIPSLTSKQVVITDVLPSVYLCFCECEYRYQYIYIYIICACTKCMYIYC